MIKRVSFYSLPEGVDPDEFWKYHTEVHSSEYKKAVAPRLKKYVINRVTEVVRGEPKFWGFVEQWWENEEDRNAAINTPEVKRINEDFRSRVTGGFLVGVEEKEITL